MTSREKQAVRNNLKRQAGKVNRAASGSPATFREEKGGLCGMIRMLAGMDIFTNVIFGAGTQDYIHRVTVVFPDSVFPEVVYGSEEKVTV